ncbi:hypothetical protein [Sandarakinorhabdus glacialis]|uniref:hypothetical protein n=1 Tax=Sandarakinorhabdus glacialis TaxID=1614636 RepID=UPI0016669C21
MVVLRTCTVGVEVFIDPPLIDGDHRKAFFRKDEAWNAAQQRWTAHRAGFLDLSDERVRRYRDIE